MSTNQTKIYTITIIHRETGRICLLESWSNKKLANSRLERLNFRWFEKDADGDDNRRLYQISLTDSNLKRS